MADRLTDECERLREALGTMRAHVKKLEAAMPKAHGLVMDLRSAMIEVTVRVNAVQVTVAGLRMAGEQPQRPLQESVEDMPLFLAQPHELASAQDAPWDAKVEVWTGTEIAQQTLSALQLLRMEASLHRAGDHTQDHETAEEHDRNIAVDGADSNADDLAGESGRTH